MVDEPTFQIVALKADGSRMIVASDLPESQAKTMATRLSRLDLASKFEVEPESGRPPIVERELR